MKIVIAFHGILRRDDACNRPARSIGLLSVARATMSFGRLDTERRGAQLAALAPARLPETIGWQS
jgi:hypothetical protein